MMMFALRDDGSGLAATVKLIVVVPVPLPGTPVIHAGTPVHGVVTEAREARSGAPAMLELAVQDLIIGGRRRPLSAVTDAFVAGEEVVLKPRMVMVFSLDERLAMR